MSYADSLQAFTGDTPEGDGRRRGKRCTDSQASRYATVIGRSIASGVRVIFQALVIVPVALLIGVRFTSNPLYFCTALLILFLISGGFAAISILVASTMKSRERFMGIGHALIMPLFFASNALYPIKLMPAALQYFALFNPLTYAVDAVRGLLISRDVTGFLTDIAAIAIFDAVMFAVASMSFRKIIE